MSAGKGDKLSYLQKQMQRANCSVHTFIYQEIIQTLDITRLCIVHISKFWKVITAHLVIFLV